MAEPETVFITADEVDEPPPPPEAFDASNAHTIPSTEDDGSYGVATAEERRNDTTQSAPRPLRPPLRRDKSAPQPGGTWIDLRRSDAEAAAAAQEQESTNGQGQITGLWRPEDGGNPADSLSLGQLKKLVQEMPRAEPTPYAFEYADTPCFEEDVEDLFDYSWQEETSFLNSWEIFTRTWRAFYKDTVPDRPFLADDQRLDWRTAEESIRRRFMEQIASQMTSDDDTKVMESLECLLYLALGCWHETAGLGASLVEASISTAAKDSDPKESAYEHAALQVQTMKENIGLIADTVQTSSIFNVLRSTYDLASVSDDRQQREPGRDIYQRRERFISQVLLYLFVDLAKRDAHGFLGRKLRDALDPLSSKLLVFLTDVLVKTRWDDLESNLLENNLPYKILQLYWKTILLVFGDVSDVEEIKNALATGVTKHPQKANEAQITASPLDYHVFRQEIISKYPAYNPPPALFPFEPDNSSFLPSLQDVTPKNGTNSQSPTSVGPANIIGAGTSILNQPVHIATPAPSPPPSPAGPGGKGLKKQNYQTNQMFPFLYPPLDESSNDLGGKGTTELQDLFAGRKWQGSDIPTSILEAADLFAKRMRATRAMKQLWEERVRFTKFEQGYGSLDSVNRRETPSYGENVTTFKDSSEDDQALSTDQRIQLAAVDAYYKDVLPRLQSVIVVLLKVLVQTITTLITQADGLENMQSNGAPNDTNGVSTSGPQAQPSDEFEDDNDPHFHEMALMREQEIMGKTVSGILLLLLKWFKVSHILKFEYLSQLLLDSNYIQFILKIFAHQELERAVNYRCERKDLNFFALCKSHSRNADIPCTNLDSEDEDDDAEPPPIGLTRQQGSKNAPYANSTSLEAVIAGTAPTTAPTQPPPNPPAPEVDELGYPTSALPSKPITNYSWRTFFTSINYLRILQKMIKAKPHRQLLMVQGKYSNTLKKNLKVPQPDVRLYTLKIIKGQVPYCHRKWRQSNMRIITAIYLHVKPGLRDEWLSGLDVEQEVGEALPAEQALRALTYWYNLRRYPEEMGMAESASVSDLAAVLPPGIAGKFSEDVSLDSDPDLVPLDTLAGRAEVFAVLNDSHVEADNFKATPASAPDGPPSPLTSTRTSMVPAHPPPMETPNSPSNSDSTSMRESTSSSPEQPQQTQQSIPPLMLREQDFFLRELEKMDLGLSLPSPSASRSSSRHSSRPVSSAGDDMGVGVSGSAGPAVNGPPGAEFVSSQAQPTAPTRGVGAIGGGGDAAVDVEDDEATSAVSSVVGSATIAAAKEEDEGEAAAAAAADAEEGESIVMGQQE